MTDLERAIALDPDDAASYLVLADALLATGDVRGELITVQHARGIRPDDKRLAKREKTLLNDHGAALLGAELSSMFAHADAHPWPGKYSTGNLGRTWRWGFLEMVRINSWFVDEGDPREAHEAPPKAAAMARAVLASPSCRFLRELRLGMPIAGESPNYESIAAALGKLAFPPTLDRLVVGDLDFAGGESEYTWTDLADLRPLLRAHGHQLRSLALAGACNGSSVHDRPLQLGDVDLPALRTFTLHTADLTPAAWRSIAAARWPSLERLEVWFGDTEYCKVTLADITPWLDAAPKSIAHLALANAVFTDELIAPLAASKVVKQLRVLDLSRGFLSDAGAEVLAANRRAFAHLDRLDLSDGFLTTKGKKLVAKLCAEVDTSEQKEPWDFVDEGEETRYVTVAE